MNKKNKKFNTKAIHIGQEPEKLYGAVSLPIYLTSTFKQQEFGEYEYDYSSNIVSFEYDEIGIWNCDDEVIEWYNDECEAIHLTNLSKKS